MADLGEGEVHPAGARFGHYEIVRLLGRGGMGAVYEARQARLQKRVALKVLNVKASSDGPERARFEREGQIASQLEHPHIVQVFDYGLERDTPYLVMELLQGENLADVIRREGALPVERVAGIMLPVIAAIGAAHDAGIVHRDLKPDNVFLSRQHRGAMVPKVLDFGISKVESPPGGGRLTASNALLGTAHYMSPEQADGAAHVGPTDDQYALGVVLYECATGTVPFDGATFLAVIHAIREAQVIAPRRLVPTMPETFERVILRAMDRRAINRFESVRALGHALLPFASPEVCANWEVEFASAAPDPTTQDRPTPRIDEFAEQPTVETAFGSRPTTLRGSSRDAAPRSRVTQRGLAWLAIGGALIAGLGIFVAVRTPSTVPTAHPIGRVVPEPPHSVPVVPVTPPAPARDLVAPRPAIAPVARGATRPIAHGATRPITHGATRPVVPAPVHPAAHAITTRPTTPGATYRGIPVE